MKKSFANTRVTVRLRKSDYYDEWYLYLEAYPVRVEGKDKPQRVREYINRSIKTPIWDKSRTARTGSDGKITYKPKRDLNGIILCKSELDQENCLYADRIRAIRQKEYDTQDLYSDADAAMAEQVEKSRRDFIAYFRQLANTRNANNADVVYNAWFRVYELLKLFAVNILLLNAFTHSQMAMAVLAVL